ncbi:MAG: LysR family transcriptional regulator [Oscillospiraceae bacterium]|nr:LysR family transcriptional regulator [Oscillospiraceae bacterium]
MELSQLRYFCAVAESQHMTQTAERLHIAQPALTQSIRRLERELGAPLFAPKGRGIVLTECGRFLYRKLAPVVETLDRLPRELAAMAGLERDTIHMNVLAASSLLTASVIEYKRQQQHIHFQLFQNGEMEVCDLHVSTLLPDRRHPKGVARAFCCTEQIFLAVPREGHYAGRSSVRLAEAAQDEFICLSGGYKQFRAICDHLCTRAGFAPRVIFESDSPSAVRNLISAGMGVGFWPAFTWGTLDTSEMLLLPIEEPVCQRDLVVTCSHNKADNREVRNYYEFLVEFFRRFAEVREF